MVLELETWLVVEFIERDVPKLMHCEFQVHMLGILSSKKMTMDHVHNLTLQNTVVSMYTTCSKYHKPNTTLDCFFIVWIRVQALSQVILLLSWFTSVLSGHDRYVSRHTYVTPNALRHKGVSDTPNP